MEIKSMLLDRRIESYNFLLELSISEYLNFAYEIIDKNEFQRRKVIKTPIREILKADLQKGCIIPSIVLATYGKSVKDISFESIPGLALDIINNSIRNRELLIIDGLQRTYVMLALKEELQKKDDEAAKEFFFKQPIRVEIYIGLKRMGLLYRMITLNTGQTTMSTRHLMEILYHDYSDVDLGGIKLVSDKEGVATASNTKEFNFKEILDGFNSYIEKDEGIIVRTEILDNIKNLDVLKDEVYVERDLFKDFILSYKHFLDSILTKSRNWEFDTTYVESSGIEIKSNPFGSNTIQVFKNSQALTGFGAALGQLKEIKNLSFDEINIIISEIYTTNDDWNYTLSSMIADIDLINNRSKKIGNDQRYYFRTFFRAIFNKESDQYLNFSKAANYASNRTREERL
jgi:hypothetical protein